MNIANALLAIGSVYFLTKVSSWWAIIGLIIILIFSLSTWGMWSNPFKDHEERLLEARINETESRTRLNNSNAAFQTANALFLREQAIWRKNHK